jgi:hypothetical protein
MAVVQIGEHSFTMAATAVALTSFLWAAPRGSVPWAGVPAIDHTA